MAKISEQEKTKIKSVLIEHLKKSGYPNIPKEEILRQLPDMFKLLGDLKIIPEGCTYQIFAQAAEQAYFMSNGPTINIYT